MRGLKLEWDKIAAVGMMILAQAVMMHWLLF